MATQDRKSMSETTRRKVYARDNHTCRKCGRKKKLIVHHIIPVAQEQDNRIENLLTLCKYCHDEWEYLVYPNAENVTLDQWLCIPPALDLIAIFNQAWPDSISAKAAKAAILIVFDMKKGLCDNKDEE